MIKTYLAFDLGAESGRGVLGTYDNGKLTLEEAGRFPTTRDSKLPGSDGVWRWDFDEIMRQIQRVLVECEQSHTLSGVAVDTWGVDFGLLDGEGKLIEHPVCYRDDSHAVAMNEAVELLGREAIWSATGIQLLTFNTIFQLMAAKKRNPAVLNRAAKLLFMPDLIANSLCSEPIAASELSVASTAQMLDPQTLDWNRSFIASLGVPDQFLQPIEQPAARYGTTPGGTPVYAAAGHDTACAIAAVPARTGSSWAYISSGTWSLVGVERTEAELSIKALEMGLSNEKGVNRTTRLLKNIMGLWLVQECRRSFGREGFDYSYQELADFGAAAPSGGPLIDASHSRFLAPRDMPAEIRSACTELGQSAPTEVGALVRCCLDSLALAYRRTLADLEKLLGTKFDTLHIVGGGTKNTLLNQLAADACGIPVVAGPAEGTGAGNILAQLIGSGELSSWEDAREVSRASFQPDIYTPNATAKAEWDAREADFMARISGS